MGQIRRITPDTSVIIAAYFETFVGANVFNVTPRAKSLLQQIRSGVVRAVAPEQLLAEVMKVCFENCTGRNTARYLGKTHDDAVEIVRDFARLPIQFVTASELVEEALHLKGEVNVSVPDSWFLACASQYKTEIWFSHDHRDGVLHQARQAGLAAYTLVDRPLSTA